MERYWRQIMVTVLSALIVWSVTNYVGTNSRISALEVQVQNDHNLFISNRDRADADMNEIKDKLNAISVQIQHLQDVKEDKFKK